MHYYGARNGSILRTRTDFHLFRVAYNMTEAFEVQASLRPVGDLILTEWG